MSTSPAANHSPWGNRLLRSLAPEDLERLSADLRTIPTPNGHVFYRMGETVDHVYFPNVGVFSVATGVSDGRMVESATVGPEGMIGLEAFLSSNPIAQAETLVQVPADETSAEMLSVDAFRRELARSPRFAELLGRYTLAVMRQGMQSTACNALHDVYERCARWLLMTHDRVEADTFKLTHEFLGMMLGVRRQSVTVAAGTLQRAGLITYRQGLVQIRDRRGLEAASCECYALIRQTFDALALPMNSPLPGSGLTPAS